MCRFLFIAMTCAGLSALVSVPVSGQASEGFVVVVNAANSVTSLTPSDLSKLFLRKLTRFSNGRPAVPVDQVETCALRKHFSTAIHGMDVPDVKSYWQELVFSGRAEPPIERQSDEDVVAFVHSNPNAIGYVIVGTPLGDVKAIAVIRNLP